MEDPKIPKQTLWILWPLPGRKAAHLSGLGQCDSVRLSATQCDSVRQDHDGLGTKSLCTDVRNVRILHSIENTRALTHT